MMQALQETSYFRAQMVTMGLSSSWAEKNMLRWLQEWRCSSLYHTTALHTIIVPTWWSATRPTSSTPLNNVSKFLVQAYWVWLRTILTTSGMSYSFATYSHFTHAVEGPWLVHLKISRWLKRSRASTFTSQVPANHVLVQPLDESWEPSQLYGLVPWLMCDVILSVVEPSPH